MDLQKLKVDALVQDPANVRTHNEKNMEAIKGSLMRFGQQKPIVVDEAGVVIAGNGTLLAAKELGWEDIWAVQSSLKGAEQTAYGIADNRAGELASWDMEKLIQQLNALESDPITAGFAAQNDFDFLIQQLSTVAPDPVAAYEQEMEGDSDYDTEDDTGEQPRAAKLLLLFDMKADYDLFVAKMDTYARKRKIDHLPQHAVLHAALDELLGEAVPS